MSEALGHPGRPNHRDDVDVIRVLGTLAIVTIHVTGPFVAFGAGGGAIGPT